MPNLKPLVFIPILCCLLIAAGCTTSEDPVSENATLSTPSPTVPPDTTAPTPTVDTPQPTTIPVVTTTPSACFPYAQAYDADTTFLNYLNDNDVTSKIGDLATACNSTEATEVNKLIVTPPKPQSPELLQARKFLLTAVTQCVIPNSASEHRTQAELDEYNDILGKYQANISSCPLMSEGGMANATTTTPNATPTQTLITADVISGHYG